MGIKKMMRKKINYFIIKRNIFTLKLLTAEKIFLTVTLGRMKFDKPEARPQNR